MLEITDVNTDKQDILNLRTLLGSTRVVAVLMNPAFNHESRLLSAMEWKVRDASYTSE
jgi:hypothetical protein